MRPGEIRALAVVVIRRGQQILACPGFDPNGNRQFYRLIGGGIEFGEESLVALKREIAEELGVELTNYRYLGVLENIFTFKNQPGHELCFIYSAEFADENNYQREVFPILDSSEHAASWFDYNQDNALMFKPEGAIDLMK